MHDTGTLWVDVAVAAPRVLEPGNNAAMGHSAAYIKLVGLHFIFLWHNPFPNPFLNIFNSPRFEVMGHPHYEVVSFHFHRVGDVAFVIMCRGKRFSIEMLDTLFEETPSIKETYLRFFLGGDGVVNEGLYWWALQPLLPILENLPPLNKDYKAYLQDYIFPETFEYILSVVEDKLVPIQFPQIQFTPPSFLGFHVHPENHSVWPSFSPRKILICNNYREGPLTHPPSRVLVGETTCFFKPCWPRNWSITNHEINKYRQIRKANLAQWVRIPQFIGFLCEEVSKESYGLLLSYIDCRDMTLTRALKPSTPDKLRKRWADQISRTLEGLHEIEIWWESANSDNVLIDVNEDAWVVDLTCNWFREGGSWPPLGPIQEDLDGLARILEFLGVGTDS